MERALQTDPVKWRRGFAQLKFCSFNNSFPGQRSALSPRPSAGCNWGRPKCWLQITQSWQPGPGLHQCIRLGLTSPFSPAAAHQHHVSRDIITHSLEAHVQNRGVVSAFIVVIIFVLKYTHRYDNGFPFTSLMKQKALVGLRAAPLLTVKRFITELHTVFDRTQNHVAVICWHVS